MNRFTTATFALAVAAMLALAGCQIPGFLAATMLPVPKIPAMYTAPDQPTVVVIDDPNRLLPSSAESGLIAARIGEDLKTNKAITKMLSPTVVEELRLSDPNFAGLPIDKIGQRVGASQVIYVLIDRFSLVAEPSVYRPTISARVKVVDVATGKRTFPMDNPGGYPITSQMVYRSQQSNVLGTESVLSRKVSNKLGEEIALLFFEHKGREVGSDMPE